MASDLVEREGGKNMAIATYEPQANDAASETNVARIDMKFEIVVIPVSDVDRAKSSTRDSGGDSTPTTRTVRIIA
jgi:hypothetical protein